MIADVCLLCLRLLGLRLAPWGFARSGRRRASVSACAGAYEAPSSSTLPLPARQLSDCCASGMRSVVKATFGSSPPRHVGHLLCVQTGCLLCAETQTTHKEPGKR